MSYCGFTTCKALLQLTIKMLRYDAHGVFSSPRALFMFRSYGHQKSSIINGGLPRWIAEGLPTESGSPTGLKKTQYPTPSLDTRSVRSMRLPHDNAS